MKEHIFLPNVFGREDKRGKTQGYKIHTSVILKLIKLNPAKLIRTHVPSTVVLHQEQTNLIAFNLYRGSNF